MKKKLAYIGLTSLLLSFTACESSDNEFSDFDYQTVYFANQYGLRTIEFVFSQFNGTQTILIIKLYILPINMVCVPLNWEKTNSSITLWIISTKYPLKQLGVVVIPTARM